MNTAILVAYAQNGVIGAQGEIPWKLPSERNRFKEICKNKTIIMGRKSFEEIGHALSYCTIMIVSKTMKTAPKGCLLSSSLEQAFETLKNEKEILVAGGAEIYRQTLPYANKIYATEIKADFIGDTYFPLPDSSWNRKEESCHKENDTEYCYLTFTRKENQQ